jgi:hypothetical protein
VKKRGAKCTLRWVEAYAIGPVAYAIGPVAYAIGGRSVLKNMFVLKLLDKLVFVFKNVKSILVFV